MYGKSNMETYITICKVDSQREFAVWLRKFERGLCVIGSRFSHLIRTDSDVFPFMAE